MEGTFEGAVAEIGGVITGVTGPSGSGKTAVLLCLLGLGARPVAFERFTPGVRPGCADNIRIRARHLHLLGPAVGLRPSERLRLRAGRVGMRLPVVGPRVGRRCFVDIAPEAVRGWVVADRIDLVVELDPSARDAGIRPAPIDPSARAPVTRLGIAGRGPTEVAEQIHGLALRSRC